MKSRAVLLLSSLAIAGAAFAQEPAASPAATERDEIWVRSTSDDVAEDAEIATKFSLSLRETPLAVGVVTTGVIDELGAQVLGDAVRTIAGVTVQPSSGVHDIVVFRGLNSLDSGLVLIDGAPEPEATFYHLYNVQRIEVLKGPSGFLYGGNPLAGVVNLVRERPSEGTAQSYRLGVGSYDTLDLQLDLNRGFGDRGSAFRFNGLYRQSDGFRDDKESDVAALNPVLDLGLGKSQGLRLDLERVKNEYSPDSGIAIDFLGNVLDVPRRRSYQSPFDFSDQVATRARVDWSRQLGSTWTLRDKAYLNDLDWESEGTIFNGVFPVPPTFAPVVFRTSIALDNQQTYVGNQFEAVRQGERVRFLVGLELAEQRDDFLVDVGLLPGIDPFVPIETATKPIVTVPAFRQLGETTAEIVAPYALVKVELGDRVSAFAGARYDRLEFDEAVTGQKRSDDEVSPMLGIVAEARPGLSLYANYSESFAPPSARVLGEREPKEADQTEIGAKWTLLSGRLVGSAALYRLELENLAIVDETGFTAQQGSQRSEGFELELVASPTRGWRYQLSYGLLDAELVAFRELVQVGPFPTDFVVVDRAGNEPAFAPEHTLDAWLVRELRSGLGLGVGAQWVSAQFIGEDNAFVIEDSLTADAFASYEIRQWRWSLNLHNLFNEEVHQRGFGRASVIPAPGFSASLGIEYRR